jgi:hypothetical protein
MENQLRSINDAYQAAVELMAQDKAVESVVIEFLSQHVGPVQATITRDGSIKDVCKIEEVQAQG